MSQLFESIYSYFPCACLPDFQMYITNPGSTGSLWTAQDIPAQIRAARTATGSTGQLRAATGSTGQLRAATGSSNFMVQYMAENKQESILKSVADFLKMEKQLYGDFHLPDIPVKKAEIRTGHKPEDQPPTGKYPVDEDILETSVRSESDPAASGSVAATSGSIAATSGSIEARLAKTETLDQLLHLCSQADVLRTDLADTNLVFGVGNPDANLMLIGEAPGDQEDKLGEPFVGKAGQLLNKILAAISFSRDDVYIANILKHRPPNNRDPLPEERQRSLPFLFRQIELINPRLILCLGRISAQTLLNTSEPMKNLRGRFHPFFNDMELLVTYHPAALLRNPAWKRDTWDDVRMLRKRYDEVCGSRSS